MLRAFAITLSLLLASTTLAGCGSKSKPSNSGGDNAAAGGTQPTACIKTGCSGTVCAEHGSDVMTTCEFKAEYACYQEATCERQADGNCGWTQTEALQACLANPPPVQ